LVASSFQRKDPVNSGALSREQKSALILEAFDQSPVLTAKGLVKVLGFSKTEVNSILYGDRRF